MGVLAGGNYEEDLDRAIAEGLKVRSRAMECAQRWETMRQGIFLEILQMAVKRLKMQKIDAEAGNRNGRLYLKVGDSELTFRFDEKTASIVCRSVVGEDSAEESYDYDKFGPRVIEVKAVLFVHAAAAA